jgi:asparagine synthase (glutamine-hydrolysing)
MCGIFGAVGYTLPDSAIERVFDQLHHRGPDGKGLFTDGAAQVTLAHTRLAVIDLQTGDQPLYSNNGNLVLIANGEIYGFEQIRRELEAKGHRFQTKSDSEVIIHLYEEYGLGCFEHLRGEFAFLLYDKAKRLLIAGRDRFGIKPLYFSQLDCGLVFASEMKAIFASGLVAPKLNVAALDPLLDGSALRFPFEAIEHLPPAHYALIDLETFESRIYPYWSPEIPASTAEPVTEPFGDAPEQAALAVLYELEEAVRLRLRADVPVGLYLSGGLDSTFVAALMKRNMSTELHSFSISFEGSEKNEREFTLRASQEIGTHHHDFSVTKQMLWDNLQDCVWHTELPFVSLAPVGKFLLSEEAKKFVTVALNGQGADEVFLGYKAFFRNALRDTRSRDPKRGVSVRQRRLHVSGIPVPLMEKLSLLLFRKDRRAALTAQRANTENGLGDSARPLVNRVQESRIAGMPIDILGFLGDRVEMAHSLEVRVPFLDHKLYDMAKWIPDDFKMRDGVEKAVLRDAAKHIVPEDLRMRRKQGFMITSDPIDLFGTDHDATESLRIHLSREAFEAARVFSYRTYRFLSVLARMPAWAPFAFAKRLRREANKVLMYIMQVHMLHHMFVVDPRWAKPLPRPAEKAEPEPAPIAA